MICLLFAFTSRTFYVDLTLNNQQIQKTNGSNFYPLRQTPVVVKGSQLYSLGISFNIPCSSVVVTNSTGDVVPYQVDSFDGDAYLDEDDEIVFLALIPEGVPSVVYRIYFDAYSYDDVIYRTSTFSSTRSYYMLSYWDSSPDSAFSSLDPSDGDHRVKTADGTVRFFLNNANYFDTKYNSVTLFDGYTFSSSFALPTFFRVRWVDGAGKVWQADSYISFSTVCEGPLRVGFKIVTRASDGQGNYSDVLTTTQVMVYSPGPSSFRKIPWTLINFSTSADFEENITVNSDTNWDGKRGSCLYVEKGSFSEKYFRGMELASANGADSQNIFSSSEMWNITGGSGDWGNLTEYPSMEGKPGIGFYNTTAGITAAWVFTSSSYSGPGASSDEMTYFDSWGGDCKFYLGRKPGVADTTIESGSEYSVNGWMYLTDYSSYGGAELLFYETQKHSKPVSVTFGSVHGEAKIVLYLHGESRTPEGYPEYKIKGNVISSSGQLLPVDGTARVSLLEGMAFYSLSVEVSSGNLSFSMETPYIGNLTVEVEIPELGINGTLSFVSKGLLNLDHLNYLTEIREMQGRWMAYTWLYSPYPRYERVRDPGEGAGCVDDTARAAFVYLDYWKIFKSDEELNKLRNVLAFLDYMDSDAVPPEPQWYLPGANTARDAAWWNFVYEDGSIHQPTHSNFESFGTAWSARAIGAMGRAYRLYKDLDSSFADNYLKPHLDAAVSKIKDSYDNYGYDRVVHGVVLPYIIFDNTLSASSALVGLVDYYVAQGYPSGDLRNDIEKTINAIVRFVKGDWGEYPFGTIVTADNNPFKWQAYGAYAAYALAYSALNLRGDPYFAPEVDKWAEVVANVTDKFYSKLLTWEFPGSEGMNPSFRWWPKISYAVSPIASAIAILRDYYKATGKQDLYEKYAVMAGLAGSFWFGNNPLGVNMYDPIRGICFDGMDSDGSVNRDSGAESTIETLFGLIQVMRDSTSTRWALSHTLRKRKPIVIEAEDCPVDGGSVLYKDSLGDWRSTGQWFSGQKLVSLESGGVLETNFYVSEPFPESPSPYKIYLVYVRRDSTGFGVDVYVDGIKVSRFSFGGAPSGDYYIYFDNVTSAMYLSPGVHTLKLIAYGSINAEIDQIVVAPVVAKAEYLNKDGEIYVLDSYWDDPSKASPPAPPSVEISVLPYGVELKWDKQSGVFGYLVWRGEELLTPEPVHATSFFDPGVPGKSTDYRVVALADDGFLSQSSPSVVHFDAAKYDFTKVDLLSYPDIWNVGNTVTEINFIESGSVSTKALDVSGDTTLSLVVENVDGVLWSLQVELWDEQNFAWHGESLVAGTRGSGEYSFRIKDRGKIRFTFSSSEGGKIKILRLMLISGSSGMVMNLNEFSPSIDVEVKQWTSNSNATFGKSGLTFHGGDPLELAVPLAFSCWEKIRFVPGEIRNCQVSLFWEVNSTRKSLLPPTSSTAEKWLSAPSGSGFLILRYEPSSEDAVAVIDSLTLYSSYVDDLAPYYKGPKAYPDPFTPEGSDSAFSRTYISFGDYTEGRARVEIFTLDGRLVRTLEGEKGLFWDGRDENGRLCPTGVYLIKIDATDQGDTRKPAWISVTLVR